MVFMHFLTSKKHFMKYGFIKFLSNSRKKEKAKEVDEYIDGVLNNDRRSLDNNEYEKKRDLLFGVANKAEESLY